MQAMLFVPVQKKRPPEYEQMCRGPFRAELSLALSQGLKEGHALFIEAVPLAVPLEVKWEPPEDDALPSVATLVVEVSVKDGATALSLSNALEHVKMAVKKTALFTIIPDCVLTLLVLQSYSTRLDS